MAQPAGNWPHDKPLAAACAFAGRKPRRKKGEDPEPEHGPVPAPDCSCGIYATTDLEVINGYLSRTAPVLGIVELGGRLIPATQGYRAAYARVAAILLIDEALTEPHGLLRELAAAYRVRALAPFSCDPEDYREAIGLPTLASEAERLAAAGRGRGGMITWLNFQELLGSLAELGLVFAGLLVRLPRSPAQVQATGGETVSAAGIALIVPLLSIALPCAAVAAIGQESSPAGRARRRAQAGTGRHGVRAARGGVHAGVGGLALVRDWGLAAVVLAVAAGCAGIWYSERYYRERA